MERRNIKKWKVAISLLLFLYILVGTASAGNGLNARYYNGDNFYRADWNATGPADTARIDPNINFNWQPLGPDPLPPGIISDGYWSADWQGFINIPSDGQYIFATVSDDGSIVLIDNVRVVDNGGDHPPLHVAGAPVQLTKGFHPIIVKYFESFGGAAMLQLNWTVPDGNEEIVPSSVLFTDKPTVPVPTVTNFGLLLMVGILSIVSIDKIRKRKY